MCVNVNCCMFPVKDWQLIQGAPCHQVPDTLPWIVCDVLCDADKTYQQQASNHNRRLISTNQAHDVYALKHYPRLLPGQKPAVLPTQTAYMQTLSNDQQAQNGCRRRYRPVTTALSHIYPQNL